MKILVVPDSFKGSLMASDVADSMCAAIRQQLPNAQCQAMPMADGGEGTACLVTRQLGGDWLTAQVQGPMPGQCVEASFGWLADQHLAVIDVASACGLPLVPKERRNPLLATSYGVGELIRRAIQLGAQRILLGVGGSATMDCGLGMLSALGWQFYDKAGNTLPLGAQSLNQLHAFSRPALQLPEIMVLCDVDNPLLGERGAPNVFALQKGANDAQVAELNQSFHHVAVCVERQLGVRINDIAYGGAAGGLAVAAHVFLRAKLVSGVEYMIELYQLADKVLQADLVVTGEGCFDQSSLHGKVVSGLAELAVRYRKPLWVFAGEVHLEALQYESLGIRAYAINRPEQSMGDNQRHTQAHLIERVKAAFSGLC